MGNFLEDRARTAHIENSAWQGVRIVRCDELTRIQGALGSAIDALTRAKPTERVTQALSDVRESNHLLCGIALADERKPPDELATQLEKQTHQVPY